MSVCTYSSHRDTFRLSLFVHVIYNVRHLKSVCTCDLYCENLMSVCTCDLHYDTSQSSCTCYLHCEASHVCLYM